MLKSLLLIGFLIIGSVHSRSSHAFMVPDLMTHEKFVHLTPEEQEKYIILVMDYMAEMGEQTKYASTPNPLLPEWTRHYSYLKTNFTHLIIPTAHAGTTTTDWNEYANFFTDILKKTDSKVKFCYYAGWVSVMERGVCKHPLNITSANSTAQEIKTKYASIGGSCTLGEISCNPAVFGFKKSSDSSLFCVSTKEKSKDSSADCREEALKDSSDEADTKAERLNFLKEKLKATPDFLESVQLKLIQSCMCDPNSKVFQSLSNLDKSYLGKIRPHRTCNGLMGMTQEVLGACEIQDHPSNKLIEALSFTPDQEKIAEIQRIRGTNSSAKKEQIRSLLDDLQASYGGAQTKIDKESVQYKFICDGIPLPEINYICEIDKDKCKQKTSEPTDPPQFECPVTIKRRAGNDVDSTFTQKSDQSKVTGKAEDKVDLGQTDGKKAECTIPSDLAPVQAPTCTITLAPAAPAAEPALTEAPTKTKVTATLKTNDWKKEKHKIEGAVTWTTEGGTEVPPTPPASDDAGPQGSKTYDLEAGGEVKVSFKVNIKGIDPAKEVTCSAKFGVKQEPKEEEPKVDPQIKVSKGALTADKQEAKAKIEGDTKGWKLVWYRKDSATKKADEPQPDGVGGDGDAPDTDALPTSPETPTEETPAAPTGSSFFNTLKKELKTFALNLSPISFTYAEESPPAGTTAATDTATAEATDAPTPSVAGTTTKEADTSNTKVLAEKGNPNANEKRDNAREEKDYEVCAKLVKGDKVIPGECVKVPKKESKAKDPEAPDAPKPRIAPTLPNRPPPQNRSAPALNIQNMGI